MAAARHHYAKDDDEEALALSLALAASLADADGQQQQPSSAAYDGRPGRPVERAPAAYPAIPPAGRGPQQQQHQQPHWQQPHWQQPVPPQQQQPSYPQPQQQQQQQSGTSSSSKMWKNPLQLLDTALQKADAALQKAVGDSSGGSCCAGCGKRLGIGPALRALGRAWHPDCFRCAACQQPLMAGSQANTFTVGADEAPYHSDCHKQLFHPVCSVCRDFIPSRSDGRTEWRENPFWKNRHCPAHASDGTPQCCSCNRLQPIGEEWVSLQDGRLLCLECLDTLVIDTKDAQPLYDEVLNFFVHMGMTHAYKVPLLLVEGPVLDEYASKEGRPQQAAGSSSATGQPALPVFHVRGLCVAHIYTTIPSVVRVMSGGQAAVNSINTRLAPQLLQQEHCSVSVLLVMYGLPRLLVGSIIAHELMHGYLRMRHVVRLPLQVEEGLCQLMAMLWLDSQDRWARRSGPYQERLLSYLGWQIRTDTSEVYGDGFRIAMESFQKRGLKALVEHVIAAGDWPSWQA